MSTETALRRVGIVGAEGAKFTALGATRARDIISTIVQNEEPCVVVSGRCHLGGVDIWAEDVAHALQQDLKVYPPKVHSWERGYKPRNLAIAHDSDTVHVVVVDEYPEYFTGMRFDGCYHCVNIRRAVDRGTIRHPPREVGPHIKSGGCWTALQALLIGKHAEWHIVRNGLNA